MKRQNEREGEQRGERGGVRKEKGKRGEGFSLNRRLIKNCYSSLVIVGGGGEGGKEVSVGVGGG